MVQKPKVTFGVQRAPPKAMDLARANRSLRVAITTIGCLSMLTRGQARQEAGSNTAPTVSATQLPASGKPQIPGSVQVKQTTSQGNNAAVVNTQVSVMGNYLGSGKGKAVPQRPFQLTIGQAVRMALNANLGALTADNSQFAANAQSRQTQAQLLPQISASLTGTETQINLAKSGLSLLTSGSSPFKIPLVIGPFHYVDAQANLNWNIFSVTAIQNLRAARLSAKAAALNFKDARELVTLAVGGSYLQLVAASSQIEAEKAQVKYAQASYDQAKAQLAAGTTVLVDVTKSLVQLQSEQERLLSLQGDYDQQKIAFCRIIGIPQDTELQLTQALNNSDELLPDEMAGLRLAFDHRQDLQAATLQVQAAEVALRSARAQRFPTVSANGFYGVDGPALDHSHGVFTASLGISIPIFEGGKIRGDIEQSDSTLKQRQAEYEDTKGQVEQDVRNALIQLRTSRGQLHLSKSNRDYALESLKQSQDRFAAGVTTSVEVIQAEQQLGAAETDYISALFAFNLSRLSLARAKGTAEQDLDFLFGRN